MIGDIAIELYEFPGTHPQKLQCGLADIEDRLFRDLSPMLRTGKRLAVRLVSHQFDEPWLDRRVHHRRLEVDEVSEVFQPPIRMIVPEMDAPFERPRHHTERKPSVLTGRVPPPLFPKPEPPPQVKRKRKRKPAPKPAPKPWYGELGQFLRETWNETGKITGCKL